MTPCRPRHRLATTLASLLTLLVLATLLSSTVAARTLRAPPSKQTITEASRLYARAKNLQELRIPLRTRRVTRNIGWAYNKLQGLGMRVNRNVPIVLDTTQEYRLLRQTSAMLRGARKGTKAHTLRKKAVTRAFELHRQLYKLPKGMHAYASVEGRKGKPELVINLDNPFFNKADRLLPIVAHEQLHMRDIGRALRLGAILAQPELRDARPGTRQHRRKQKLQAKVDTLMSSSKAETRAFRTQARALALAGWPVGNWWRAPQGTAIDTIYPPDKLNRALVKGYMQGIGRSLSSQMRTAEPKQRTLARRYLAGYKAVLRSQATAYVAAVRKDDRRDQAPMERYKVNRTQTLQRAGTALNGSASLTADSAYMIGQADAYSGAAPTTRAQQLLYVSP